MSTQTIYDKIGELRDIKLQLETWSEQMRREIDNTESYISAGFLDDMTRTNKAVMDITTTLESLLMDDETNRAIIEYLDEIDLAALEQDREDYFQTMKHGRRVA